MQTTRSIAQASQVENFGLAIPLVLTPRSFEFTELPDQNYEEAEASAGYRFMTEVSSNILPYFGLLVPIEKAVSGRTPAQKQMWFEVSIPYYKEEAIKRLLWECERRLEYQNHLTTLVPFRRVMHKKKVTGGILFKDCECRIRLLFDYYSSNLFAAAKTPGKFSDVCSLLIFLFTACREMQDNDIYFGEYRPENILYDETNNQQPFRLFDRLVEGVDPIKRIANSLLREKQESLQVKPPAQSTGTSEHYKSLSYKFAAPGRDVPESLRFVRKNEIRSIAWIMVFAVLGLKAFDLFDANNKVNDQMLKEGLAKLKELGSQEVADIVERILREEDIYKLSIKDSYLTVAQAPKTNAK